jgi:hypothetical protein
MIPLDPIRHKWDLVVTNNGYGHLDLHRALVRQGVPIIALDLGDSPQSAWAAWRDVLQSDNFFFFRREFYKGQEGIPLQYAYYAAIPHTASDPKYSLSFLYRPTNHLRTELSVEFADFPDSFVGEVTHHEYLRILSQSKFSVGVRGAGWDTLRYWEIPAQGAVLCRMPSPIEIPNDFQDGVNCVEFSTADELREKITHYLNNSSVYNTLRANSLEHFKKFHTTKARAQQMLDACGL